MQWYDEIKMHDFNKDHQRGTGHFTQVTHTLLFDSLMQLL